MRSRIESVDIFITSTLEILIPKQFVIYTYINFSAWNYRLGFFYLELKSFKLTYK